jgi:hypothetical protein
MAKPRTGGQSHSAELVPGEALKQRTRLLRFPGTQNGWLAVSTILRP